MRLIADGVVDREGVAGLASHLGYSERHLHRQLAAELGAGPLALARAQRAQTARLLIESSDISFTDVAFAAGFSSVRQFNDTVRTVFGRTPTRLRADAAGTDALAARGRLWLRLAVREPFDAAGLLAFLRQRAVPGVEEATGERYRRTVRLAHGTGVVELRPRQGHVHLRLQLEDLRDLGGAVERCRRLLDLDADPSAIDDTLRSDPLLAPWVKALPGIRVPGHVDGAELAVRAVLGQQVTIGAAKRLGEKLVAAYGEPLASPSGSLTHLFPTPAALAEGGFGALGMPAPRRAALVELAGLLEQGALVLDPGADRDEARERLLAVPGIGPWTASYVGMRALRDPDAFLPTDAGIRRALGSREPAELVRLAEAWRPWRSYAVQHCWASLGRAAAAPLAA
jgi:AraC family transcriptional regulator of adaptative response / DNA-3-methyladenine glycosylase II